MQRQAGGGNSLEAVERFAQRRWRMVLLFTITFAVAGLNWAFQLDAYAGSVGGPSRARIVMTGMPWAVWGLAVLRVTFGSAGPRWSARERRVLDDELAAANRRTAVAVGYWLLLAGLAGLGTAAVAGAAAPILLRVAVPILVTAGVAGPALVFSVLQQRADVDAGRHG
ncbi:MAG TPA: hypothetical protein VGD56_05155 [Gemmatirosa sp.]